MENFVVLFTHLVCRHNIECKTLQLDDSVVRRGRFSIFYQGGEIIFLLSIIMENYVFPFNGIVYSECSYKKIDLELCVIYFVYGWWYSLFNLFICTYN